MIAPFCILLIDDDKVTNYLNKLLLEAMHPQAQITICENGQKGLEYLEKSHSNPLLPHLIFVDIKMPVMDGFGFLEEYIERNYHQHFSSKLTVLSSSESKKDIEKIERFGIASYKPKPLTEDYVQELLNAISGAA